MSTSDSEASDLPRASTAKGQRIAASLGPAWLPPALLRGRQIGSDRVEQGGERRANGVHGDQDGNRDAGGDQRILDGSGAGFALYEVSNCSPHFESSLFGFKGPFVLAVELGSEADRHG